MPVIYSNTFQTAVQSSSLSHERKSNYLEVNERISYDVDKFHYVKYATTSTVLRKRNVILKKRWNRPPN